MNYASVRCDAGELICINHFAQKTGCGEIFGDTYETGTAIRQRMRPTDQKRGWPYHHASFGT
jgi:hypothetical protein